MIDRGEPYIIMERIVAAIPQKSFLVLPCNASKETKATVANTRRDKMKIAPIFFFAFFGANVRNIAT